MKTMLLALLVAGPGALAIASPTFAASPAYCALYGREYAEARISSPSTTDAIAALERLEDQAFYRCLNMDEEPELPQTSVYYGAPLEDIIGEVAEGDASAGDETPDTVDPTLPATQGAAPATKAAPAIVASSAATSRGTKLQPWTPEWQTWCAAHYRSFDPKSGMIQPFDGPKRLCS